MTLRASSATPLERCGIPEPPEDCVDTYLMERGSANPNALKVTDLKSGFHECEDGVLLRAAAIPCQ